MKPAETLQLREAEFRLDIPDNHRNKFGIILQRNSYRKDKRL